MEEGLKETNSDVYKNKLKMQIATFKSDPKLILKKSSTQNSFRSLMLFLLN